MTRRLVALDLPGGSGFVDSLRRVWDRGDAAFPLDQRLPEPARIELLSTIAPSTVIDATREVALARGRPVDEGDALVVASSGSTGPPKGVVLTHDGVAASARASNDRLGVTTAAHWLACLPLAHVGGLSVVTRALAAGTGLTVLPGFEVDAVVRAAHAGATHVSLVATALARIDPTLFTTIVLGGAAAPAHRPRNAVTTYGMTETGGGVVYDGRSLEGVEVRIDDDGQVHVRGPMLLRAYRDGTDPLVDGWLATGDLGRWLADGRLHVDGRAGDVIVTGGEKVWPDPVEVVLRTHPAVADVAVAGRPDPEWGARVTAYVVAVDAAVPPSLDDLRGWVKASLAPYCAPRALILVDQIPRTALGKPRRSRLP